MKKTLYCNLSDSTPRYTEMEILSDGRVCLYRGLYDSQEEILPKDSIVERMDVDIEEGFYIKYPGEVYYGQYFRSGRKNGIPNTFENSGKFDFVQRITMDEVQAYCKKQITNYKERIKERKNCLENTQKLRPSIGETHIFIGKCYE